MQLQLLSYPKDLVLGSLPFKDACKDTLLRQISALRASHTPFVYLSLGSEEALERWSILLPDRPQCRCS